MLPNFESIVNFDSFVIFLVLLLESLVGFINSVYFITLGYGNSICSSGVAFFVLSYLFVVQNGYDYRIVMIMLQSIILSIYGARLSVFIYFRNKDENYLKTKDGQMKIDAAFPKTILIWVAVASLFYCYTLPVLIGLIAIKSGFTYNLIFHTIGTNCMILGVFFESVGDYQKQKSKQAHPNSFCRTGLYKIVRMPNYFGEIMFWIGCFLSGVGDSKSWIQLILSLSGSLFSLWLMIAASVRLDRTQYKRYQDNPDYLAYRQSTPVLFPFLPIYSLLWNNKTD